jgi:UPF0716 protein FxsA
VQQIFISTSKRSGGGCGCLLQLFLLFTLIPVAELWVLLVLSREVGLLPTLGLVIFTGALGALLARTQGLRALHVVQAELASGRVPTASLLDGLLILMAGVVLLTPGLFTDLLGFVLLIPLTRGWIRGRLTESLRRRFILGAAGPGQASTSTSAHTSTHTSAQTSARYRDDDERVILVEDVSERPGGEPPREP